MLNTKVHSDNQKKHIRKQYLAIRKQETLHKNQVERSGLLLLTLQNYLYKIQFKSIMWYYPLNGEVPVLKLANSFLNNKTVLFPKVTDSKLRTMVAVKVNALTNFKQGFGGVYEPHESNEKSFGRSQKIDKIFNGEIDVVIIPGLCFCKSSQAEGKMNKYWYYRMGYGGGFYDVFLSKHKKALKIGVFYEYAKCPTDFHYSHDVPLDIVITEKNIYKSQ